MSLGINNDTPRFYNLIKVAGWAKLIQKITVKVSFLSEIIS